MVTVRAERIQSGHDVHNLERVPREQSLVPLSAKPIRVVGEGLRPFHPPGPINMMIYSPNQLLTYCLIIPSRGNSAMWVGRTKDGSPINQTACDVKTP